MPALRRIAAAAAAAAAAIAGCGARPAPPPIVDPPDGLAVAIYLGAGRGHAVVDDRRTIEVTGRRVLLDGIAPGAALPTLLIEPLGAARGALAIGACARERLSVPPAAEAADDADAGGVTSPLVACAVAGPPGRHRVRVHYVAPSDGFRTRHEIAMAAPDRATISTRLTARTPALRARGELVLHDGVPGAGDPPREVGRGPVTFDGGVAVIAQPPREVPARLVRVFDGMVRAAAAAEPTDEAWGEDSHHRVRVVLDLGGARLLPGRAHVRIAVGGGGDLHDLRTAYDPEDPEVGPARLPLWVDPLLRGTRRRSVARTGGRSLVDRVELTVSNTGGEPREVWIEEPLRPARRRELARIRGPRPELAGDVARAKVVVGPGEIARLGFTVRYAF